MTTRPSAGKALPDARIRARIVNIVESLPEAKAVPSGDRHLGLEVRGRRFGWYLNDHHGDRRIAINFKAPPGGSRTLVESDPATFHSPAFVGQRGWGGMWLDHGATDWGVVKELLTTAYRLTAPKKLIAMLDGDKP